MPELSPCLPWLSRRCRTEANPDVERFGYKRGGVTSVEIPSSHLVMLSHPNEVADLIRTAIAGC
jgi:hypothetical protein